MEYLRIFFHYFWGWLDVRSILLFSFVFLVLGDVFKNKMPKDFPPGPMGLPFLGNIWDFDAAKPHLYMAKLAEKYGDVFTIRLGTRFVIVNGYKLVKEVLVHQGGSLTDRPPFAMGDELTKNQGLVLSNGYLWMQQRRFSLMTLRNFGVGKRSLEHTIVEECRFLNEAMEDEQGRPFDPQFIIHNAVSNIICSVVFGNRYEYTDRRFQELLHLIDVTLKMQVTMWTQLYNVFPTIMKIVPGPHHTIFSNWKNVISFVKSEIQAHKEDWNPSCPRDYIDCYLDEIEKSKDDVDAKFDEENLCFCVLDLFVAGTETTATTLCWALLFMTKYPEIQKKVQDEIDRVIGQGRQPSMADRANMPYTDAVIHEVQRMGNIIPLNLPRMATKDITVRGYVLPKGTQIFGNLTSVLFDKNEWETPHHFNPEHFLEENGKFVRRDAFMPFSAGKRVCLGEQLARMELFLFFTSFLQRFTISPPPGVEPSLEFKMGSTLYPKELKICAISR
ncbi:cytochrome P450 2J4-like [Lepisosteus oculatus]|uniref:cytochrome P450 2J4-like n=1 Tax=Lepisosteus oculatus TaxID=7918 RepID=UPI0035F51822